MVQVHNERRAAEFDVERLKDLAPRGLCEPKSVYRADEVGFSKQVQGCAAIGTPDDRAGARHAIFLHQFTEQLAVAGKTRLDQWPDVPSVAETIPGFEVIAWFGVLAPGKTPRDIVARLYREFTRALALPDVREKIAAMGFSADANTPEEFGAFMQAESEKFGKLIRQYNISAD